MTEQAHEIAARIRHQRTMTPSEREALAKRRASMRLHTRDCRKPEVRAALARSHQP